MGISFLQNATGVVNINDYPPPSLHNLHINIHHQWIFGLDWLRMNDEPDVKSELVWYHSKCVFLMICTSIWLFPEFISNP